MVRPGRVGATTDLSAAGAVHTLLVAIDRRYTALRRGSDLAADFRELAYSLHTQPDDAQARRVYAAAFGRWPSVHAAVATVEEEVAFATAADAGVSRHQVEVVLREHERSGPAGGRPRRVPDAGEARTAALQRAAAETAARRRFTALLLTDGEVRMTNFSGLETPALAILLGAVETALHTTDPLTGYGEAQAEGASVVVRVRITRPGATVAVRFAEGVLWAPDLLVSVGPADTGVVAARVQGAA